MPGKTFRHKHTVRFGEIDYAGIVYYPNFFDFYQQTEEEFMEYLGFRYHHLLGTLKQGFPIVHVDADFKQPIRYGDTIEISLKVAHLGNSSVTFRFHVRKEFEDELCATADIHHVLIDTEKFKPMKFPDDMRSALEVYLLENSDG